MTEDKNANYLERMLKEVRFHLLAMEGQEEQLSLADAVELRKEALLVMQCIELATVNVAV